MVGSGYSPLLAMTMASGRSFCTSAGVTSVPEVQGDRRFGQLGTEPIVDGQDVFHIAPFDHRCQTDPPTEYGGAIVQRDPMTA